MSNAEIKVLEGDELARELAEYVLDAQDEALASAKVFNVAISGGSLAKTMAKGLVNNPRSKLNQWAVFLADERIVPNTHEDSNYYVFKTDFLDKLPKEQQPRCFPLNDSLNIESTKSAEFAKDYQHQLLTFLGNKPVLDFVYLGAGPDAHTCSLFPGHELLKEESLFVSSLDDSPKPPPRRITLTKRTLKLAKKIVFVASGAGKQDAIKGIFSDKDDTLPARQVNELAQNKVVWFCDKEAVAKI